MDDEYTIIPITNENDDDLDNFFNDDDDDFDYDSNLPFIEW
jgi:hypothetical protein